MACHSTGREIDNFNVLIRGFKHQSLAVKHLNITIKNIKGK